MRYAAKVDAVQPECVNFWKRSGKLFVSTARQGDGAPDGYLLHMGLWIAIEFKAPKGKLEPKQTKLHAAITAKGGKVYIIRSIEDAAALIGARLAA
jgi:hypothetical protein